MFASSSEYGGKGKVNAVVAFIIPAPGSVEIVKCRGDRSPSLEVVSNFPREALTFRERLGFDPLLSAGG